MMNTFPRGTATRLAAAFGCAAIAIACGVAAQGYPDRPIRLLVPTATGTITDLSARQLSEKAAVSLGQPILIENRVGASGTLAAQAVARAKPDGYTLFFGSNQTQATNAVILKNPGYDSLRDFTPVVRLVVNSQVLAVTAGLNVRSVAELVDLARAKPNTLTFASAGKGTTAHLSMEMLKAATGITMTHVPYNTPQLLADVVGGHTSMIVYPYQALKPLVESGKLRALATMGEKRAVWMPDAPTMIEAGYPGFTWASWFAIFGPAQLPREIVLKVAAAYEGVLKDPALAASLAATGSEAFYGGAEALAETTRAEIERVRRVVQSAKITFDE